MPIKFLLVFLQARPVVPLPIKGSKTISPSLDQDNICLYGISYGNTAGCLISFPSITIVSLFFATAISHIL